MEQYQSTMEKQKITISELTEQNKKLSKYVKIVKVKMPDGTESETIERSTKVDTSTRVAIRTEVEREFRAEIRTLESRLESSESRKVRINRKLMVGLGIDVDLNKYGYVTYDIWGPAGILLEGSTDGRYIIGLTWKL